MSIKSLILTIIETIIKVVILAVAVMYILRGISYAYDFGYRVFADEPVSSTTGRTITVGIGESADVKSVATMLEEKGLIRDARLFVIQEYLSAYHNQIQPGIYDLSTSMTSNEMLAVLSEGYVESEDDEVYSNDNVIESSTENTETDVQLEDSDIVDTSVEGEDSP